MRRRCVWCGCVWGVCGGVGVCVCACAAQEVKLSSLSPIPLCVQVPIEVRDAAREKIQSLETERGQLEGALAGFRSMKG